ncbi:hypothetical protein BQ8482_400072 [Mesorhizobium delmotii]|uniref:Uncharacterized protein n=1 Tax=Mesorhizobium delmotii TaxID=1631247 RepID=A0A2P9AT75_9HYPH|nr:hypothetical protein BQ8482_400072 [Mesorhizobium delmotii]
MPNETEAAVTKTADRICDDQLLRCHSAQFAGRHGAPRFNDLELPAYVLTKVILPEPDFP